jgi:hypothetical protein
MTNACSPKPIARGGVGTVEFCRDCQVVHLSLGSASIRFTPAGFKEFCATVGVALHHLLQDDAEQRPEESGCEVKDGLH